MKDDPPELTRADFDTADDYARYLLQAGLIPESVHTPQWMRGASGKYVELFRASADLKPTAIRAAKSARHIAASDFENAYRAASFSNWSGTVMNVHLTIVWETVEKREDLEIRRCLEKFLERFRKWNSERSFATRWIYVQERVPSRGLHTHILASVDKLNRTDFERWALRCIKTVSGRIPIQNVQKGKTIVIRHRANDDVSTQWRLFQYLMKGVDPDAEIPDIQDRRKRRPITEVAGLRYRKQGNIFTKRVGVSRSLDRNARMAAGFKCVLDEGAVSPNELYTDSYWRDYLLWKEQRRRQQEVEGVLETLDRIGF